MNRSLFDTATVTPQGYREIEPSQIPSPPDGVRIIDVREPAEFTGELGHIPGAELVPLATVSDASASWSRDAELLVVCRSGGRSARAAQLLCALGFRRVINLFGGMMGYNEAGLPISRAV